MKGITKEHLKVKKVRGIINSRDGEYKKLLKLEAQTNMLKSLLKQTQSNHIMQRQENGRACYTFTHSYT